MARGLNNRNPGNIRQSKGRYKGEVRPSRDPAFKQFETMAWGYRAIFVLLHTYRTRHGLRTIAAMIARWAPPSENKTELYIRTVSRRSGIPADRPIDHRERLGRRHARRRKRVGAVCRFIIHNSQFIVSGTNRTQLTKRISAHEQLQSA